MKRKLLIRNIQAREQLEYFIISGVSSVLLLRYYLYLTGYPQVGSASLHISHMLWGGTLMMVALVLLLTFLGRRMERLSSVIGGVGFGIFIDEVGKFVTKDNNYFFRPSVGIIYAVFVVLYLLVNYLTRNVRLTSTEYQLNALNGLEEAVLREMDEREKATVGQLLKRANQHSAITKQLQGLLDSVEPHKLANPNLFERASERFGELYDKAWRARSSRLLVRLVFIAETLLFIAAVVLAVANNIDNVRDFFHGQASYGQSLVIGQAVGTAVAAWFVGLGLLRLRANRYEALEWFRRATMANLLLTEFFIFSRIQFGAIPGFIFNLVLLIFINFVLSYERRQAA